MHWQYEAHEMKDKACILYCGAGGGGLILKVAQEIKFWIVPVPCNLLFYIK
jgi:hypothetical protein